MMRTVGTLIVTAVIGLMPASASAQNAARPGKWTIELYGGGSAASGSSTGNVVDAFEPGASFAAESGQQTRSISSWYFGDGALLLNQALTQLSNLGGINLTRIIPLDAALLAPGGNRGSGSLFGVRVGKALSSKLSIEVSVEKSQAQLGLSDALKTGLQASSDSFETAFTELFATAPANTVVVDSVLTMPDASNANIRIAGAAKWTVFGGKRLEGYVTGGGGLILNSGEGPSAILNGRYSFRYFGLFPMSETDRVVVTVNQKKTTVMGLVGGGVTYDLSEHTGLRADVQLHLSSSRDVTTLSAAPLVANGTPTNVMSTVPTPSLQFSTQVNIRSSLSGTSQNLTVFEGSGLSKRVSFTLGIFKRF